LDALISKDIEVTLPGARDQIMRDHAADPACAGGLRRSVAMPRHGGNVPRKGLRQRPLHVLIFKAIEVATPATRDRILRDAVADPTCAGGQRRGGAIPRHGVTRTATRIGRATLGGEAGRFGRFSKMMMSILRKFTVKPILFAKPVQTNLVWKTRELGGYGVSGRSQQQIRYKFESTQYKKYHPQRGDGLARISPAK
jgi:hypothetical protein